ncbi:hypothetical protein ATEG_07594 [Aspergillus terreus NIH2624]|uniref:Sexual development protein n=1 Tax=Aspergillus terreus (strain NIH 2624 / FGSC A1156) TaxID=341663 RepID=Q0CFE0_ASPTN|nr:uncharacterized protein ATEG_07594 [Aspergillus terreus NIH2624]EAU31856.1 hypothetical protein ATEG_07594 [Aspergillus terreus NIH2624]
MTPISLLLIALSPFLVLAAPTIRSPRKLPDGMPNPSPEQLCDIQRRAHGTLPGLPLPETISEAGITNLQLIAFNELFEVAFFYDLLSNVTDRVEGYTFPTPEDRHTSTCPPSSPASTPSPSPPLMLPIELAATFTDLVIGTLEDVTQRFAEGGDTGLTRVIAATIGNEGEQEGWFRVLQRKIPSEVPTLTTSDVNFAFSAANAFVVKGTCPNLDEINLKIFPELEVLAPPGPKSQIIKVTWALYDIEQSAAFRPADLWLTYINQLNPPITERLDVISFDGRTVVGQAYFPYDEHLMNGLTIAVVTMSPGPFANVTGVAGQTHAGPGLIIVN